jgi:hypothetical protein
MANTLKERLTQMRSNIEGAKKNLAEGGSYFEVPGGVYVGHLIGCSPEFSQADKAMMVEKYHITAGEYKGKTVRNYQSLENEVGIAIVCEFLQSQGFDAQPEDIFDLDKSEKEKRLCYSEDFIGACVEVQNSQPACQFRVSKRPSTDGQSSYTDVNVIEWIQQPGQATPQSAAPAASPVTSAAPAAAPEPKPEPEQAQESEQDKQVRAFAMKVGLDIKDNMTIEQVKEVIASFEYPVKGVKEAQLLEKGYAKEDITDDSFISTAEADLLADAGLGEIVILPDPKFDKPAAPAPAARKMMRRK